MELVSLKNIDKDSKIMILQELGYDSDGNYVLDKEGKPVLDKYLEIPVQIDKMVIFPGSTIILDDNEVSISSYMAEFGDVL